ncbi:MAG: cache domain-containing protein [Magnetospirillum sp.]|nr:cache domain-containing protein [Magnetospirillum sp.]
MTLDEKFISRLQLVGTVMAVSVLVLGLGFFFIRQITAEGEDSIQALEAQQIQSDQDLLVRQVETAKAFLSSLRTHTEKLLKAEVREQVDQAHAMATAIYQREKGKRSDAEIKTLIVEALRPARFFGGKGYFFIDGMDGSCVLLPIAPGREGTSLMNNRDDTGRYIMRGLIEAARLPVGDGFSRYRWFAPGNAAEMADKIAYVRHFAPFDWLIGTGQYVSDVEGKLKGEALDRLRLFRFGRDGNGYIAVFGERDQVLVSPSRPTDEGKSPEQLEAGLYQEAGRLIIEQGRKGDGFVRYDWPRVDGSGTVSAKLTYVSRLEDWNWTLAAGLHLDEMTAATAERRAILSRSIRDKLSLTLAALAIGVTVALGIGIWFSALTGRLIGRYKDNLTRQNDELRRSARDLFLISSMVDSSAEMVFLTDCQWRLIYANPFAYQQLGGSPEEMLGQNLQEISAAIAASPMVEGEDHHRFETNLTAKDGRVMIAEIVAKDLVHEDVLYHFAIARDISERRRWQTDLENKTTALERSNADLEQFAYVASHDLREPLRMVASYLSLLERRYGERLDKDGQEFLDFARDGAQRLDRLVLDLLEFSRIDRKGAPIRGMVVGPALQIAVRNLAMAISESGGRVDWGADVEGAAIKGDAGQIVRLFQNLIGNAIKYRDPDRPPQVLITGVEAGASWEFRITDNGIGIEPQYFERIFGIFQRLHTRDKYDGTGIGLAVCKKIVERHGGSISVKSEMGKGSTFTFILPKA